MSALRRVVLVLAVALALVLVALAVALPRIAASDRVRARLVSAVEDAARRSFSYRTLDARLVPPRLVLEGARLEGTSERPAAEAGRVELRLALLPLVARTLVVRSLQLEDAALALVRDETGFHLAGSDLPEEPDEPAREPSEPPSRRAGFELAVQRVALERVDVRFDDARPGGAPSLELRDVEGELRARSLDAPVELALRGTAESAGELAVRGGVALRAALEPHAAKGTFELDARDAELAASAWLHKPAGTPATLRGRILRTRDENARSLRLEGVELELGGVEAALEVDVAPVQRIVVDAPALDADALSALVPALRSRELAGTVALERFAVELSPLAVRGLVRLDPLGLGGTGAEHLVLRGALEGAGDELVGRELRAAVGGRETPVELRLAGLASEPRFEVATHAVGIESSALVGALGGKRDALEGPLDLDARLTGRLGGRRAPLATLAGEVRLRVGPGRLRNASLLRAALAGAARAGRAAENEAVLAQAADDRFESLSGRFRIERGVARTDDLRLVYPTSAARLAGSIGLADRSLDLDASAELGREGGAKSPRAIPLASVRGTLDAPEVELTDAALAGAATAYTQDERRRRKWTKKLDERLGEGQGEQVLEALDKALESLEAPEARDEPPARRSE